MKLLVRVLVVLMAVVSGLYAVTPEPDLALKIKNKGSEKIHVLVVPASDFRHILDAGGWTKKSVNALLSLSTDVLTFLPDIEKSIDKQQQESVDFDTKTQDVKIKKGDDKKNRNNVDQYDQAHEDLQAKFEKMAKELEGRKLSDDKLKKEQERLESEFEREEEQLKKKFNIKNDDKDKSSGEQVILAPKINKIKISKEDVQKAELWIGATSSLVKTGGAFLGNILPHIALAAISKKDYATQIYPGTQAKFYKTGKKPLDSVMHLKDLVVAIFPDDGDGVAEFYKPLFVRSFDPQKYNAIYYGPKHGHATYLKVNFTTGEVLKATEKSFLPVQLDTKSDSGVKVPEEGHEVLDEVREAREAAL